MAMTPRSNPLPVALGLASSLVALGLFWWLPREPGDPSSLPLAGAAFAAAGLSVAALRRGARRSRADAPSDRAETNGRAPASTAAPAAAAPVDRPGPPAATDVRHAHVPPGREASVDGAVHELAGRLRALADRLQRLAAEASTRARTGCEHAAAVAAAVEELSATIASVGENGGRSARAAEEVVAESGRLGTALEVLQESADAIGGIVDTVRALAEQTRMLALNAAIEAARVGEAGRGFAVVAGEVKALARRTAEATTGIEERIEAMRGALAQVHEIARAVDADARTASEAATAIATAVEQQSAASADISERVRAIASTSEDLVRLLDDGSDGGEGLLALARHLERDAEDLEERTRGTARSAHGRRAGEASPGPGA